MVLYNPYIISGQHNPRVTPIKKAPEMDGWNTSGSFWDGLSSGAAILVYNCITYNVDLPI